MLDRGDQREDIFRTDADQELFLVTLSEACSKTDWQLHAFCRSYPLYLKPPHQRPPWLRVDRFLGEKGIPKDSEAGREQLATLTEGRRTEEGRK